MINALWYLQINSLRNLAVCRLKRLARPRYLIGALFAIAYFGFVALRPFLMARRSGFIPTAGRLDALWETVAAALLLLGALLAWVFPHERAGLIFTEAEIAFLFPAPATRRTLLLYKLIKSQLAIFFTIFFLTIMTGRVGSGGLAAIERAIAWWLVLTVINLHLLGSSFARTMLLDQGISNWTRRLVAIGLAALLVGGAVWWVRDAVAPMNNRDVHSAAAFQAYLQRVWTSPPVAAVLAPFRAVVRPFFAAGTAVFGAALLPALALFALHFGWVLQSDVAFEEASIASSRRHAARVVAMRSGGGNRWAPSRPTRKIRPPFRLAPTGLPAIAFLWKNLLNAGQLARPRFLIPIIVWALSMGYAFSSGSRSSPWQFVLGVSALALVVFSALLGPHVVRNDFRQDLPIIDLMKSFPLSGTQMAVGQLLSPVIVLTVFQWTMLALGTLLLAGPELAYRLPGNLQLALCAAVIVPPLNVITLFLPNAAALLYPSWFETGPTASVRGIEVFGQRLMFMLALIASLALTLAPAAGAFGFAYFVTPLFLPDAFQVPLATAAAALALAAEGAAGVIVLGRLYERFDPSAETIAS